MLQCEHLFCVFGSSQIPDDWGQPVFLFCTNDVMRRTVRYEVIYHHFPINSQYLKTWGVDSPACSRWKISPLTLIKES